MDDWLEDDAVGQAGCNDRTIRPYRRLLTLAHRYFSDMTDAQPALHYLHTLFSAGQDVKQRHCDFGISSLTTFREPVQLFCSVLREPNVLDGSSLNHYVLILALFQIEEQAQQIRSLLSTYRLSCHLYTAPVLHQKHDIEVKLKQFVQNTETLLQKVSHFIEETYFLEKQQQRILHEQQATIIHSYHGSNGDVIYQEEDHIIPIRACITSPSF